MAASQKNNITDLYPIELHYIKALFVEGQYRQCVQACRDIVKLVGDGIDDQPLRKTFINFYLALCHDEIARAMHHNSVAKLPCFGTAEECYLEALESLPSPEEARTICERAFAAQKSDPFMDDRMSNRDSPPILPRSPSILASSMASSPPLSPVSRAQPNRLSFMSPTMTARTFESDNDDLESHDSFSELMTPNRKPPREFSRIPLLDRSNSTKQLPRDISRMSLLEENIAPKRLSRDVSRMSLLEPKPQHPLQRENSTTFGLLRPIRPGSPTGKTRTSPNLPPSGTTAQLQPLKLLPKIATRAKTLPHLGAVSENGQFPHHKEDLVERSSPVSPISRIDSPLHFSDASTVSALSPRTPPMKPFHSRFNSLTLSPTAEATTTSSSDLFPEPFYLRTLDHITSLRHQLTSHLASVQTLIAALHTAQADRISARHKAAKHLSSPLQPPPFSAKKSSGRIQQARSYWSFVPEDVKATEKQQRIQEGRARRWERKRFDARRYRELCEKAMAEL